MKKDRDTIDDMLHSKLYDFEVETSPEDWDAIEKRLPNFAIKPVQKKWYYWAAAAVAAIAIISSSILWNSIQAPKEGIIQKDLYVQKNENDQPVAPLAKDIHTENSELLAETATRQPISKKSIPQDYKEESIALFSEAEPDNDVFIEKESLIKEDSQEEEVHLYAAQKKSTSHDYDNQEQDKQYQIKAKQPSCRKWRLGMGVGNLSAASNSGGLLLPSFSDAQFQGTPSLLRGNANYLTSSSFKSPEKQNIKHKVPLSFGISTSYQLSERWSLQSGLLYSYLVSEWETNEKIKTNNKQKLHFVGVPVSIAYKLAEWKQVQFYLSAGGKVEFGVGGQLRTDIYSFADEKLKTIAEKERMKNPYFSVNGHIGASYPLLRFLSAYAEVGADYYFDNGSDIETYHSDKPLNIGLQLGLRFNL